MFKSKHGPHAIHEQFHSFYAQLAQPPHHPYGPFADLNLSLGSLLYLSGSPPCLFHLLLSLDGVHLLSSLDGVHLLCLSLEGELPPALATADESPPS